jgi:hypothetical protein
MMRRTRRTAGRLISSESGFATLIVVLVILAVGSIVITPILYLVVTGHKVGGTHQEMADRYYAADAGIQDAEYWIGKDLLTTKFTAAPAYSSYDFLDTWEYDLPQQVNDQTVHVTIENIWIPTNIAAPSEADARRIIEADASSDPRLIVKGSDSTADKTYTIKISYFAEGGETLLVNTVGVWLPPGWEYLAASSSLDNNTLKTYYVVPTVSDSHAGGKAVLWNLNGYPFAGDATHAALPGVNTSDSPMECTITFRYTTQNADECGAVAWITTNSPAEKIPFAWDAESKVFRVTSTATSADGMTTTVESYIPQNAARKMAAAINGDYVAAGNSLVRDADHDSYGIRETANTPSSSTISTIPSDSDVAAAYLYWSAWRDSDQIVAKSPLSPDTCSNYNNWNRSGTTAYTDTSWGIGGSSYFSGQAKTGSTDGYRTLTLKNSISTSPRVDVSWDQRVAALAAVTQPNYPDACDSFSNWATYGSAWDTTTSVGKFTGLTYGGRTGTDLISSSMDLSETGGAMGSVNLSWDQYVSSSLIFSDPGTSDISTYWVNGGDWSYDSGAYRGRRYNSSSSSSVLLTSLTQNLSGRSSVTLSWDWWTSSSMPAGAGLRVDIWNDGGSSWTSTGQSFTGTKTTHQTINYSIPAGYLNSQFKMRFVLLGSSSYGSGKYCYIDNIKLEDPSVPALTSSDGLDVSYSTNGTSWTTISSFRGPGNPTSPAGYTIPSGTLPNNFYLKFSLVGFDGAGEYCYLDNINIEVIPQYSSSDGLDFAFSGDGGSTWSSDIRAFRYGDSFGIDTSSKTFSYTVPSQYSTSTFKIRFYLVGFAGSGKYCNIDNIKLTAMAADQGAVFKIDGNQVYHDSAGDPQIGAQDLKAERATVLQNWISGQLVGYNYCCYTDVTDLVRAYSQKEPDPATNHTGNGTYTVGGVDVSMNYTNSTYTGQPRYSGWSLIIIYQGPTTKGHQLYLFDAFTTNPHNVDLDFDGDGTNGGSVSGFLVPDKITGEVDVAKMTCFVCEGDDFIEGDWIALNAPSSYWDGAGTHPENIPSTYKLWDGITTGSNTAVNPDNVWNSKSLGASYDGVDIDTFSIPWASGRLNTGDTSAHVDIWSDSDGWTLVYMILSFRSQVTTGGSINYLIRG